MSYIILNLLTSLVIDLPSYWSILTVTSYRIHPLKVSNFISVPRPLAIIVKFPYPRH